MSFELLRAWSWINRFGGLPRVERAFEGVAAPTFVTRPLFGYSVELDVSRSTAQQLLFVEGERFVEERFLLQRLLRPGMTVVDVGANIGYYLLLFEREVGAAGKVVCIEPSAENLPELRRNIELNRLSNVELHDVALGAVEGTTGLETGINSGVVEGNGGTYQVPLRRLDRLVEGKVDFLKIDVEGYEGQVLEGAAGLIRTERPVIFLELHPHIVVRFGHSIRQILEQLSSSYDRISLFEKIGPDQQTLIDKLAVRYLGRDPVVAVSDVPRYIERYDRGDIVHTFWAVCEP